MSVCGRCGAFFDCGMVDSRNAPCWCTQLPVLPRAAYAGSDDPACGKCFCPVCLRALTEQAQPDAPVPD